MASLYQSATPNWSSGKKQYAPDRRTTEFEDEVARLELTDLPDIWLYSESLCKWVRRNYNRRYVPEELLEAMGLRVDTDTVRGI